MKNLLTGLAPTQVELDSVAADPTNLGALVDARMVLPAYAEKMELLFAEAFQQSQASQTSFKSVIDDGTFTPEDGLLLNFRQSFATTMTELMKDGHPLIKAATTTRYMMTTAVIRTTRYSDASVLTNVTVMIGAGIESSVICGVAQPAAGKEYQAMAIVLGRAKRRPRATSPLAILLALWAKH